MRRTLMPLLDLSNPDQHVHCRNRFDNCTWEGKLSECKKTEVNTPRSAWASLAGREGYEFHCPHCGWLVHAEYTRMS